MTETVLLGAGCFWCIEAVLDELEGVISVESGYAGGRTANPTYAEICRGDTGHAEVVRVQFDSEILPFADLLRVFFTVHDPTTLNRQGNDVGTQYRSVIFHTNDRQRHIAQDVIAEIDASGIWSGRVVTELAPAPPFTQAEAYHQEYFAHNPAQPYCVFVVAPKVRKFRASFADRLKRRAPGGVSPR